MTADDAVYDVDAYITVVLVSMRGSVAISRWMDVVVVAERHPILKMM